MADTNVKFLKENNLYEAHKQFMRLAEGYGYAVPIEEAGEDDDQSQNNPMGGNNDPSMGGGADASMGGGMPGGSEPSMDGADGDSPMGGEAPEGDASMTGGSDASMGGGMPGGDDSSMGGADASMPGGADPTMGADPSMDAGMPNDTMGAADSDEDVIDVDDVVKAQEKTNDKVNSVGRDLGTVDKRIEKLLGALEDMQGVIDRNNAEIVDLKREFERRNPTQTEKLNLRSLDSYPFNVRPTDYWKAKGIDSNYQAYADNDEPTTQEYEITNDDVDRFDTNIDKTFNVIPDDDIQDINKIFNL